MSDLRKAAEMALEALETLDVGDSYKTHNAASALREALANEALDGMVAENQKLGLYDDQSKHEWVSLSDEDYEKLLETKDWGGSLIQAVELKLKEKNGF